MNSKTLILVFLFLPVGIAGTFFARRIQQMMIKYYELNPDWMKFELWRRYFGSRYFYWSLVVMGWLFIGVSAAMISRS